jgi:hypothetical protein
MKLCPGGLWLAENAPDSAVFAPNLFNRGARYARR